MPIESITVNEKLLAYITSVSLRENHFLEMVRKRTETHPCAKMLITPEQAQFMTMLIKLIGAKKCLEIGVFTGYSTLATALGLPEDGKIIAIDRSREWTSRALRHWQEAGVDDKIELRVGEGMVLIPALIDEGHTNTFDFIFIDADKKNYENYYQMAVTLCKPNGLIMVDNTLWRGSVIQKDTEDLSAKQLKSFNRMVFEDNRVDITVLPMADGIHLIRKKGEADELDI
ncbi:MAG: class I SAM-dependent methyltransferase [Spirochaetes bacterium]|nr:class I SAM-dependent methyltransferase [Spirochaetota bacterium]MBN2771571.1 class I SAM-dependent methyltransferase [Spirochaetota bacterium]